MAVREDHIEMAEFLLKEGADVNFRDQDQRSVLHKLDVTCLKFLMLHCLQLLMLPSFIFTSRSPLMIAAGNGQIGMLRLLLRYDADITIKDTKGWSADDYAVMNGHHP